MKTYTRYTCFITLSAVLGLTALKGTAQQDADYSQALRELDIMSNIFNAASDQLRDNNNAAPLSSFDSGLFLANQGMIFTFRMQSQRHIFRAFNIGAGIPGMPPEDIMELELDMAELANEITVDLGREFPEMNFGFLRGGFMPGMSEDQLEAMEEMSDIIRDRQESIRDQQREIRDLQRQLRTGEGDNDDIENRLAQAEEELDTEMDELDTQSNAYSEFMQEYQEVQQQQVATINQQALDGIMTTLCDYGVTLRSLQNNEHVTLVLEDFNDNQDQVYVFDYADVASCSSAEQLLQSAIAYQI